MLFVYLPGHYGGVPRIKKSFSADGKHFGVYVKSGSCAEVETVGREACYEMSGDIVIEFPSITI